MPFTDGVGQKLAAGILLMTMGAGQIHLALTAVISVAAPLEVHTVRVIDLDIDRHAAGLMGDVSGQRQQFFGFVTQDIRTLPLLTTLIDSPLQIAQFPATDIPARISRGDTLHRCWRITVAAGAGFSAAAGRRTPQLLAARDPQHAGIAEIIGLQGTHIAAGVLDPGFGLRPGCFSRNSAERQQNATNPWQ